MIYFFRTTPDTSPLALYSNLHILMLIIWALGIIVIYKFRNKLKNNSYLLNKVKYIFSLLIFLVISSLYLWYILGNYMGIKESLPLYHCRLAMIFLVVYTLKSSKILKNIITNWAIFGATIAMFLPITDPFNFPHLTFFTFFVGHIVLWWYAFFIIVAEDYIYNIKDLKISLVTIATFNFILVLINKILNANYGYVTSPPILKEMFSNISPVLYIVLIFLGYILLTIFSYFIIVTIQKVANKNKLK